MKQYQQGCVGAFIQNSSGEFLAVKRADNDDFLPGLWELPGGGSEFGEEPQTTVVREIKEETGLVVDVIKPIAVSTHFMPIQQAQGKEKGKIQRIEITFLCTIKGNDKVILSAEHSEYRWVKPSDVPSLKFTEYMNTIIADSLRNL